MGAESVQEKSAAFGPPEGPAPKATSCQTKRSPSAEGQGSASPCAVRSEKARSLTDQLRTLEQRMAKQEMVELEGVVSDVLPSAMFRVALDNGHFVLATIGGKMRQFRIRVLTGDRVKVEVSPYDLTRGRITFRHKQ